MKQLVAFLFFMWATAAGAGDCQLSGSVCVDTSPSKNISGVTVTLAEVGGCWEYEDTYTCLKPNAVNYCQPFVNAQPQCWQTGSQCSQMDTLWPSPVSPDTFVSIMCSGGTDGNEKAIYG
jgi:conjugal transfer mating pair stabilization protein TraN